MAGTPVPSPFSDCLGAASSAPIDLSEEDLGAKPRVLMDRIADRLGAERHALLLVRRSVRTIRGHKSTCLHLIFMLRKSYIDLLRATRWARFDWKMKCWYLPEEFVTEELLTETFSGRFTHIVDLDAALLRTTGAAGPGPSPALSGAPARPDHLQRGGRDSAHAPGALAGAQGGGPPRSGPVHVAGGDRGDEQLGASEQRGEAVQRLGSGLILLTSCPDTTHRAVAGAYGPDRSGAGASKP